MYMNNHTSSAEVSRSS